MSLNSSFRSLLPSRSQKDPGMCALCLYPVCIAFKCCQFLWPRTSLRKEDVLEMAEVPHSCRLCLQSKSHPTRCPLSTMVAGPRLSLLAGVTACKGSIFFRFSATWGSRQGPWEKQPERLAWRLIYFSSLKVTFSCVPHTSSGVCCPQGAIWHSARSWSACRLCPVISVVRLCSLWTRCHHRPCSWIPFCWRYLLPNFVLILLKKLFTSYQMKAGFWVL